MNKIISQILTKALVMLLFISLTTSATALPIIPPFSKKQKSDTTSNQKINDVLSMIDETLILEYLQDIVGFGPRMTKCINNKCDNYYIGRK